MLGSFSDRTCAGRGECSSSKQTVLDVSKGRAHLTLYEHAEQQGATRTGTLLGNLLFVRDVTINYRNTELSQPVNNSVSCMAVIALPDMYLGMS
jgi:hypothetical protein